MLWFILLGGVVALGVSAYLKPHWFNRVWETTLKELWVGFFGILLAVIEYLNTDPTWHEIVDPKYAPYALVGVAILGVLIRRMNLPK